MGWWRNFIRSKTKPIPMERALKMRNRLSFVYVFCAWNAFAFGVYFYVKENYPRSEEEEKYPSKYYHKLVSTEGNAKVMRFSGVTFVEEFDLKPVERPNAGKTWMRLERERQEREEQERKERERTDRQDLNLLVEETSSL